MTPVDTVRCACACPTPGVRPHGGADQEAVGREGEQRLVERAVVGRAREARPDVELRRARPRRGRSRRRRRRSGSPSRPSPSPAGLHSSGPGTRGAASAWRMKSGSSAESSTSERVQSWSALLDRHGAARERAAVVHAVDRDRERRLGRGGAREDRVHRLHRLVGLPRERGDDRLAEELAAEHDAVSARRFSAR